MGITFWQYVAFCGLGLSLIVMPGADFFYVLGRGMSLGPRAGVASAVGIASGLLFHTVLAASGLTLVLAASPAVFNIIKWLGAAYLVWIGVQTLRAKNSPFALDAAAIEPTFSTRQVWQQGILTNILNPKVTLTFTAFLPQFIHAKGNSVSLQMGFLGLTMCLMALSWFSVVGAMAGRLGKFLLKHPRAAVGVNVFAGTLLTILGVCLALDVSLSFRR